MLAAAPTTPPCFRRWRRSSLLQRKNYFNFRDSGATAFVERSVAMKAPVGLLSGRAVCVSRWRGFAPTSSADAPLSHFHGWGRGGKRHLQRLLPAEAAAREATSPSPSRLRRATSPKGRGLGIAGKLPRELQSLRFRQRLPPRGSWQNRQVLTEGVQPSPWGRWLRPAGADGRGKPTGANSPSRLRRQPPLRWGLWHNGKVSGSTAKLPVSPEAPSQRELAKPSGFD